MKIKLYYILIVFTLLIAACSKDDDTGPPAVVESFDPISIKFVSEDGSVVLSNDCLDPNKSYDVQIEAVKNSQGNTTVSKVEYTINGATYSMTFSQVGAKKNPIVLVDGKNIAELVTTGESTEVTFIVQGDFELVN